MKAHIYWIIDDKEAYRMAIETRIKSVDTDAEFIHMDSYPSVKSKCEKLRQDSPHAIILDYLLGDTENDYIDGLRSLRDIRAVSTLVPVFMLTGHSNVKRVLNPLNLLLKYRILNGYFEKNERKELERLCMCLKHLLMIQNSDSISLNWTDHVNQESDQLTGVAGWMYKDLPRKAILDVPVLIQGPTGSGKELVARRLHKESFRVGNFIPVNCGAIPEQLFEIEFFGHERGAFTDAYTEKKGYFERAEGGTLFLDEVAQLSKFAQAKLLRALEEGFFKVGGTKEFHPNVRIISATNKNLKQEVRSGSFRHDLYYRLCGVIHETYGLRHPEVAKHTFEDNLLLFFKQCLAEEYMRFKDQLEQFKEAKCKISLDMTNSVDEEFKVAAQMAIRRMDALKCLFEGDNTGDTEWLMQASTLLGIPCEISVDKWEEFIEYSWPGNYREVRSVVRTAVSEGGWENIRLESLAEATDNLIEENLDKAAEYYLPYMLMQDYDEFTKSNRDFLNRAEYALFKRASNICNGASNPRECIAKILGMKPNTLSGRDAYRKLRGLEGKSKD